MLIDVEIYVIVALFEFRKANGVKSLATNQVSCRLDQLIHSPGPPLGVFSKLRFLVNLPCKNVRFVIVVFGALGRRVAVHDRQCLLRRQEQPKVVRISIKIVDHMLGGDSELVRSMLNKK